MSLMRLTSIALGIEGWVYKPLEKKPCTSHEHKKTQVVEERNHVSQVKPDIASNMARRDMYKKSLTLRSWQGKDGTL
eukprot:2983722-Amphidinium_carterae.1